MSNDINGKGGVKSSSIQKLNICFIYADGDNEWNCS